MLTLRTNELKQTGKKMPTSKWYPPSSYLPQILQARKSYQNWACPIRDSRYRNQIGEIALILHLHQDYYAISLKRQAHAKHSQLVLLLSTLQGSTIFGTKPVVTSSFKTRGKMEGVGYTMHQKGQDRMSTDQRWGLHWGQYGHRICGRQELRRDSHEAIIKTKEVSTPYEGGVFEQKPHLTYHRRQRQRHMSQNNKVR